MCVSSEDDLDKSWRSRLLAHRFELLIASCVAVAVTLVLGIGLGGEELSGNLLSDNGGSVARTDSDPSMFDEVLTCYTTQIPPTQNT